MKSKLKLLSWLCLLGAAALLVWGGLAPEVRMQSLASSRYSDWDKHWRGGDIAADLDMPGGLLPSNIPGPADTWAGGKAHEIKVRFKAEPGDYTVELLFNEAHEAAQPLLAFSLNGAPMGERWVPKGHGHPAPYEHVNPALTLRVPITVTQPDNELTITNKQGSWAAPARIRLLQGIGFFPAKLGWELLYNGLLFWGVVGLLVAMVFLRSWAGGGLGRAIASTVLMCFMVAMLFVFAELLFRQYLIHVPQARSLAAQETTKTPDAKGKAYNYVTMIQPNPDLEIIYNLKPNLDGFFAKFPLKTNSHFMRGAEAKLEAAPGVLRVMGLGDSVMFGWGVSDEQSALTRLGRLLVARMAMPVETLNLGCPSYNTANEVAVFRKMGRKFKPKLVVLIFVENDFGFPGLMIEPVLPWTTHRCYIKRQLSRTLAPRWRDAFASDEEFVSTRRLDEIRGKKQEALTAEERWHQQVSAHYNKMVGTEAVAANFRELANMLKADGAMGVVVYNPIRIVLGKPETYEKKAGFVVKAAREAGLMGLDMTPVYEKYLQDNNLTAMSQALWVNDKDWHPNGIGHSLIADAIMAELERCDAFKKLASE